ncbi:MAG TPA: extracellular solute-binding protein, partial [Herbaspirillum sp.]|nr:extracellular solute-binding protein [Herbaspirillum sp.]
MIKTIKINLSTPAWPMLLLACLVVVFPPVLAAPPPPPLPSSLNSLQVLHWWTSDGERKAANVLIDNLAEQNIQWRDIAIPGGAGTGASKVLKSMVLAGHAPDVTQLNGVVFEEWADLGLLLELDAVAGGWKKRLFPTVWTLINNSGHFVAVPLGIHRINNLYYNRAIFTRLGLTAPTTWAEFETVAERLRQAGITPLAQSA